MPVRLLEKNREVFANSVPNDGGGRKPVHTTICYTGRYTLLYSD
jgi:hypothetical protein